MGRKKSIIKIAKSATIHCPFCDKKFRIDMPQDGIINKVECKKCKQEIRSPITKCCVICAFSDKPCSASSIMEAKIKGLEIRKS